MIRTAVKSDRTAGWTFSLSLALHLLVIIAFANTDIFRPRLLEAPLCYVELASLPTPDPAPAGGEAAALPPQPATAPPQPPPAAKPPAPVPAPKPAMTLPAKQPPAAAVTAAPPSAQSQREQEAREFSDRMSRLERGADARHQSDALASLQKRVAARKEGISTGSGVNPGADYGALVQSRLKDALGSTIVYRSKNPEAAVHIYIDRNGKLVKYVMVRPSADKLFNGSVIRTIEKAKADFPPVPAGTGFDKLYVFSPQEVKK